MKLLHTLAALTLTTSAIAGTAPSGKAPAPVAPVESALFTGSVSLGYDSAYYFRGLWFSNNNAWGGLNLSTPLTDKLSLGLGSLYTSTVSTDVPGGDLEYSELDLAASLNYDAGFAKFGLAFTSYQFYDTFSGSVNGTTFGFPNASDSTISNATDLGFTMALPLGSANLYLGSYYDFKIDAFYFEAGADYTIAITDKFSIVPAAQLGYGIDYYTYQPVTGVGSGWNHVRVAISAPYKVTNTVTITPYIAGNFSLDGREQLNSLEGVNDVYGGVSVSVSF